VAEAEADARRELEVVPRLGRRGRDLQAGGQREGIDLDVLAVADDGVARVEADEHAARRVELQHAAHVHREVRLALTLVLDGDDRARLDRQWRERLAEADEAGARLGKEAEASPALADLRAELHLLRRSARRIV